MGACGSLLRRAALASLLSLGIAPGIEAATLYWWQDQRGVTHITDEPPPEHISYEKREVDARTGKEKAQQTSEAVRDRRCRDFQGALTQLRGADNVPADGSAWRAAKQRAQRKIQQWCHSG